MQVATYCILLLCLSAIPAFAQEDTILMVKLKEVQIKDTRVWGNDTVRYHFNQTRYYVQTILPYVETATELFTELNEKINDPEINKKQRKKFIAAKEEEARRSFEDKVKNLNETQGVLLVKLIARQTGVNIYSMLSEFKNPLTALKWQAWSRLHGFNINKRYDPTEELLLEQVMLSLDYPLPDFYEHKETATALKNY
jgi:hypothetical protein